MPARKIVCAYCGREGQIDVWGLNEGVELFALFKYLGHNPLSGHMHFQCPSCEVVSLVSPMSVLGEDVLTADHLRSRENRSLWTEIFTAREDRAFSPYAEGSRRTYRI